MLMLSQSVSVRRILFTAALSCSTVVYCEGASPVAASALPGQVVVTGTVPDDASKLSVLNKLREVYGPEKVVDQISVGAVVMPPNWSSYVQKLINPNLKLISRGQFKIDGNVVSMRGEVSNEAQKQQIASDTASVLNPSYVVNNGLRIATSDQGVLDQTLANRVIEFEVGKAEITVEGKQILDEMVSALKKIKGKKVEVIGHTDDQGFRANNLALSQARAEAVRLYLSSQGLAIDQISTSGAGPDRPVASNTTGEGRARNRRIEFRIFQ